MLTDEQLGSTLRRELNTLGGDIHPSAELTRQLLADRPRRRPRRRVLTRRLPAVAVIVAAIIVVAVLLAANNGPSIVARAYAATAPTGVIVHYVETLTGSQRGTRPMTSVRDVWRSGDRTHLIVRIAAANRSTLTEEVALNGPVARTYMHGTISIYREPTAFLTRSCSSVQVLTQLCNNNARNDPVTAMRRLARSGQMHVAGSETVDGHRVDQLVGTIPHGKIQALVNPRTFLPTKIEVFQSVRLPHPFGTLHLTTTVTNYQQLPITPHNTKLLRLGPHPGAPISHRCVANTICAHKR
jgi:hypothetical protein